MSQTTENNGERRAVTGLALKWIHIVIVIAVNLLTIGAMWATMRTQLDEVRQQVTDLKEHAIMDPQWKEFRDDIERRLARMEKTLDEIALKKEIKNLD